MKKLLVLALMVGSLNAMALQANLSAGKVSPRVELVTLASAKELAAAKYGANLVSIVQISNNVYQAKVAEGGKWNIYNLNAGFVAGKAAIISAQFLKAERIGTLVGY